MELLRSDLRAMLADLHARMMSVKVDLEVDHVGRSIAVEFRVGDLTASEFEREFGGPVRIY